MNQTAPYRKYHYHMTSKIYIFDVIPYYFLVKLHVLVTQTALMLLISQNVHISVLQ